MKLKSPRPWHADVDDHTSRATEVVVHEQVAHGFEGLDPVAGGDQEPGQRTAHRDVVVDHDDPGAVPAHVAVPLLIGMAKLKVAPRVGLFVAQMRPPCASMIEREIDRPMPRPVGLVV